MKSCPTCGCDLPEPAGGKPRSVEQIRRYFAMIRLAHLHWPELHAHQFTNAEALRAFLQMKAGWREVGAQIPLTGLHRERAMILVESAIRGAGSYALPVIHGDTLVVFKPKSVSFKSMPHAEFCKLVEAVEVVIEQETGIRVDELMRNGEAA